VCGGKKRARGLAGGSFALLWVFRDQAPITGSEKKGQKGFSLEEEKRRCGNGKRQGGKMNGGSTRNEGKARRGRKPVGGQIRRVKWGEGTLAEGQD